MTADEQAQDARDILRLIADPVTMEPVLREAERGLGKHGRFTSFEQFTEVMQVLIADALAAHSRGNIDGPGGTTLAVVSLAACALVYNAQTQIIPPDQRAPDPRATVPA